LRSSEANWVGKALESLEDGEISPVLELGTTSREYREKEHSHIAGNIHFPLSRRHVRVVTTDLFDAEGVDIAGDIFSVEVQSRLAEVKARCVLVCNIFEHVRDARGFAAICDRLLQPGGIAIVTVPYSYPYHLDPIDTLYRPSPQELIDLFPSYQVIRSGIVQDTSYWHDLRQSMSLQGSIAHLLKNVARSATLREGKERSLARLHRMLWLFRRYSCSCLVARKPLRDAPVRG